ncbi:MAG: response regulator, partial [Candidatus Latescibacteria bacterium]|nr:response regulator [Candidatus Latescibacterota bacterium]
MPGAKILIVEDENIVAKDIELRLKKMGHFVPASAPSAEEAIRVAGEVRPDLVLMDIMLRGDEPGTQAAGVIRERFDIPVIYLTAYADRDTLDRARVTEPFGYILKPFD